MRGIIILPFIIISLICGTAYGANMGSPTQGGCIAGWIKLSNWCYYVNNQINVTWHQAQTECSKRGSELLTIASAKNLADFKTISKTNPSDGFWTGLNQLDADGISGTGTWTWGRTGYADMSKITWNTEPDYNNGERCGAVNIQGTFSDDLCSKRFGFICEKLPKGGCPFAWLYGFKGCYLISNPGNASLQMNYKDATAYCKTFKATLVTVISSNDQTYLQNQMTELTYWTTSKWWTGLNDIKVQKQWLWANGDPFNSQYITWTQQPNQLGGAQFCGIILRNGKFNDYNCTMPANFICKVSNQMIHGKSDLGCGPIWTRAGRKCYFIQTGSTLTWPAAKAHCSSANSHLAQIESQDELNWLTLQVDSFITVWYWIGLNDRKKQGTYVWSDGSTPNNSLLIWNREPNNWSGNEQCAIMLPSGFFNDAQCSGKAAFACEYKNTVGPCKVGWTAYLPSSKCYYVSQPALKLRQTWYEAKGWCRRNTPQLNGYLIALNSLSEKNFILGLISKTAAVTGIGWWTGLSDQSAGGVWQNDQPLNSNPVMTLITWNSEPNDQTHTQNCIVISLGGRLMDLDCKATNAYICEYKLAAPSLSAEIRILLLAAVASVSFAWFT